MAKKRITLVLPPELWERTQQVAHDRHNSASEYVAEALRRALGEDGREAKLTAARALIALRLPVGSPEALEAEAAERYEGCCPGLDEAI